MLIKIYSKPNNVDSYADENFIKAKECKYYIIQHYLSGIEVERNKFIVKKK